MKLVLDTNSLFSDFYLRGATFTVIAHEVDAGNLEVVVPEVVVLETVGNFHREIGGAQGHLSKFSEKFGRLLSDADEVSDMERKLVSLADKYETTLRRRLDALGARVEAIPDVAHADLVRRAAERRAPCDSHGNGYRDSLIWHTVVSVAEEDDDLVFVTRDDDFGDDETTGVLHPDLLAELAVAAPGVELTLRPDIVGAIRELLASGSEAEIAEMARQVRLDVLNEWLADAALHDEAILVKVESEPAGLPRSATGADVNWIEDVSEVEHLAVLRRLGDDVLVEFECEADVELELWVDDWDAEHSEMRAVERGRLGQVRVEMRKRLVFDCLATLDSFGRPVALEVTRVHAHEDDPGLLAWDPDICGCTRWG